MPDVIATQTNVFDNHAQVFMKAFFDEIFSDYNVSNAITRARDALKNALKGDDVSNTFYQYIHLSQTPLNPRVVYKEPATTSPQGKQYFASLNHPSVDMRFVRRYNAITQIESCYREENKAVMVYGMGGTGKTSLSVMLEQTLLEHYDASLRVNDALWLDLRTSPTVGAMIVQLSRIIADKGNHLNAERMKALEDPLDVPDILNNTFGNDVFLTIDNCETLIDTGTGRIDDKTFAFLINLIAHTTGWKVLLTSREPFPLEFENRMLFNYTKYHLGCLTFTERVALLDVLLHAQRKSLEEEVQDTVLREVAGNPYELHLFVKNLSHGQEVDTLIKDTHAAAGEYACLDYYLGKVTADVLSTLHLLAVFQETPTEDEINAIASLLAVGEPVDTQKRLQEALERGLTGATPPCSNAQRAPGASFERRPQPTLAEPMNEKKATRGSVTNFPTVSLSIISARHYSEGSPASCSVLTRFSQEMGRCERRFYNHRATHGHRGNYLMHDEVLKALIAATTPIGSRNVKASRSFDEGVSSTGTSLPTTCWRDEMATLTNCPQAELWYPHNTGKSFPRISSNHY